MLRGRKLGRDRAILESELAERPGDPFVLFNLGAISLEGERRPGVVIVHRSADAATPRSSARSARGRTCPGGSPATAHGSAAGPP